jgi:hypothetical protein
MALFESSAAVSMPVDHFIFRAGKSARGATEAMASMETNLKEIGLDRSYISMSGRSVPSTLLTRKTLGVSISDEVLQKFGFEPVGASAAHEHAIRQSELKPLGQMLQHEGIKIKDISSISNLLVFKESSLIGVSQTRNLKTALHEIGHAVSEKTGAYSPVRTAYSDFSIFNQSLSEFADEAKGAQTPFSITRDVADEFQNIFLRAMGEHGIEEARAESFSGLISRTKLGQDAIAITLSGKASEEDIRRTFGVGYAVFNENYLPFTNYSERYLTMARSSTAYNALASHLDFDEMTKLGAIEAHGKFMGSVNYR